MTITTPGSYRLTSNLIIPADEDTDGIKISTSDVGIDLNNFAIIRSGCEGATTDCAPTTGTGSGVERTFASNRGLSVKNGSITGMGFYGVQLGNQAEVTNLRVRWNRVGGIAADAGSTVSGNTAYQNGTYGIFVGVGSTVSGNTALLNGGDGIATQSGATVSGNATYLNGGIGINALLGVTIIGNTSYENGDTTNPETDHGIQCNTGCIVRGNSVRANSGYGLNLGSLSGYRENVVSGNTRGSVLGGVDAGANVIDGVVTPTP